MKTGLGRKNWRGGFRILVMQTDKSNRNVITFIIIGVYTIAFLLAYIFTK